jgi:membrane fusion protein, peptide pheromone/bacteriocin exporter
MHFSSDPINTIENLITRNKTKSFSIYLVLVLCIVAIIALLPIIKLDISSQSRGMIRSKTDNVPLIAIVSGRIVWTALHNNVTINKGDTLVKIAKEGLMSEKKTQDTLNTTVALQLEDMNRLLTGKTTNLKTAVVREDYFKFQSHKTEFESKIAQAQMNYSRNKGLFEKGVIAKAEYEKYGYELQFATQALQSFVNQQKATWESQKHDLQERIKNLNGTVAKIKVEETNYVVLAPISGTIEKFSGVQVGSFINASQPIATISPMDNLIVESTVSPNDIGLIQKNQRVKFQIDAFNYNQWGLLEGKVIEIDKNITLQENQAFFKVRCSMNTKTIQLQSGYKTQVSKGMMLTTRYVIAQRSLFDLLFDKMNDWLNPKLIDN